ncbi:hypothetical protein BCR33DRAFT_715513 [Rhizoclosmatium globosum]|uniref:L domain-like protein n=1 Tax=Rhizoclosmatium globosum TaxID=329046 RepID=A0A1Y2CHA9_9FUNG|nr:hypothetical protein BCR33DRAFT_715513 [Rhizoclosmatium globosum]|eukprot:ORY46428.1 hypothetical protein BCR33DRAFT_715513 [Rhizoclosmatium globosum]
MRHTGLYVNHNNLTGPIPAKIGNLVNLWQFNVSRNQLSGSVPNEIKNFVHLNYLNLSENEYLDKVVHEDMKQNQAAWRFLNEQGFVVP